MTNSEDSDEMPHNAKDKINLQRLIDKKIILTVKMIKICLSVTMRPYLSHNACLHTKMSTDRLSVHLYFYNFLHSGKGR